MVGYSSMGGPTVQILSPNPKKQCLAGHLRREQYQRRQLKLELFQQLRDPGCCDNKP